MDQKQQSYSNQNFENKDKNNHITAWQEHKFTQKMALKMLAVNLYIK
jgi:hypothetical protein